MLSFQNLKLGSLLNKPCRMNSMVISSHKQKGSIQFSVLMWEAHPTTCSSSVLF